MSLFLVGPLGEASTLVEVPVAMERIVAQAYDYIPLMIAAIVGLGLVFAIPHNRWVGILAFCGMFLGWIFALGMIGVFGGGIYKGPPDAPGSLFMPNGASQYANSQRTAEALNSLPKQHQPAIAYVPADVPSTGPLVVSVNPIDDDSHGMAALGRDRRCYLSLGVNDPPGNTKGYGYVLFGILPEGRPCLGTAANRTNVTSHSPRVWARE